MTYCDLESWHPQEQTTWKIHSLLGLFQVPPHLEPTGNESYECQMLMKKAEIQSLPTTRLPIPQITLLDHFQRSSVCWGVGRGKENVLGKMKGRWNGSPWKVQLPQSRWLLPRSHPNARTVYLQSSHQHQRKLTAMLWGKIWVDCRLLHLLCGWLVASDLTSQALISLPMKWQPSL